MPQPAYSQSCHVFSRNLGIGAQNEDVAHLARILVSEGLLHSDYSFQNGSLLTYDARMASAVSAFQERYAAEILTPSRLTHGTGYVGVATRAKLNRMCGANLQNYAPSPAPTAAPSPYSPMSAGKCGFSATAPISGAVVGFPLTVTGFVDNSNRQNLGCSWQMFEGQAGIAQLYYNYGNRGWNQVGAPVPVRVSDWTAVKTSFSVTLNFSNDGIGLPIGTPMKIVFTEENASGLPGADTFELPVVFGGAQSGAAVTLPAPASSNYLQVPLAGVINYASLTKNNLVMTSGTVVAFRPTGTILLTDNHGKYVLVTVARAFSDRYAKAMSQLTVGTAVTVRGVAQSTNASTAGAQFGTNLYAPNDMIGMINLEPDGSGLILSVHG